jgi:F420H(2)-dependent quinone reductase
MATPTISSKCRIPHSDQVVAALPTAGFTATRARAERTRPRKLQSSAVRKAGPQVLGQAPSRRVLGRLQQAVINPVVKRAWDLGVPIPGDALLETLGRRTQLTRRTPVCDGLEGETFWLVAQRGARPTGCGTSRPIPASGSR